MTFSLWSAFEDISRQLESQYVIIVSKETGKNRKIHFPINFASIWALSVEVAVLWQHSFAFRSYILFRVTTAAHVIGLQGGDVGLIPRLIKIDTWQQLTLWALKRERGEPQSKSTHHSNGFACFVTMSFQGLKSNRGNSFTFLYMRKKH